MLRGDAVLGLADYLRELKHPRWRTGADRIVDPVWIFTHRHLTLLQPGEAASRCSTPATYLDRPLTRVAAALLPSDSSDVTSCTDRLLNPNYGPAAPGVQRTPWLAVRSFPPVVGCLRFSGCHSLVELVVRGLRPGPSDRSLQ